METCEVINIIVCVGEHAKRHMASVKQDALLHVKGSACCNCIMIVCVMVYMTSMYAVSLLYETESLASRI